MVCDGECATRGMSLPHQEQSFPPPGEDAIAPFLPVSTCRTGLKVSPPLEECSEIYRTQVPLYMACLLSTQSARALKVSQAGTNFPYMNMLSLTWRTAQRLCCTAATLTSSRAQFWELPLPPALMSPKCSLLQEQILTPERLTPGGYSWEAVACLRTQT